MALTLTTSGSLNTTVDNYAFSILSNTSSVQLGAVSLKLVVPGGCTIKNVNAGTSSVDSLVFLQQDGNLNIGMYTLSNWVVNTNDVILSITASGMSTGSFTLNTDEDWYCEIASSSAEPFTDFAIKMPSLASPYASVSTTLEAVSILSGVNPSITAVGAPNSSVFGSGSRTSGTASIAEGIGTLASGLASHAAGINTTASGQAAFSMGIETDADGMASFAAGSGSWARGTATVAFGIGTIASSSGQLAVGHYNEAKTDINNIFVVGDGTSNSLRRNVIEVYGGQGASLRGVKIDTVSPSGPATTTIDGFNVYGRTIFYGGVTQSANIITIDGDYGGITHGSASYIAETYTSLGQLRGRTLFNYKGIDFNNSVQTTAPSSTHLWTNSSNRLFYSSSAVILNGGNTLGSTMLIGTNDTNNLELETSGSARMTINSSGNIGIGTATPSVRLHLSQSSGTFQRVDINNANADGVNATTEYYTNTGATPDLFGATSFRLQGGTTDAFKQFQVYIANLTSPRFIINGSGNVGIGTTSPQRRLHVDASGSANTDIPLLLTSVNVNNRVGILFASSSVSAGRQHNLYHRNNSPLVEWILSSNSGESATWNFLPQDDTSTGLSFVVPRTTPGAIRIAAGVNQSMLSLGASGSNQHLNISSSGNVGIGTTNTVYTLDVNGIFRTNNIAYVGEDFTFTSNQRRFLLEASADGIVTYTNNTTSVANTTGFLSGEIYLDGSQPYTNHRAINTIVTCRNTSTSNILRGFYASGRTGNSGAASKVTGFTGGVNIEGSGNVTDAIALEIELFSQTNSKTITNLYGLKLGSLINSAGTITNTYGVYIDSLAAGTQTNAAFGLYQAGSDKNYFAGNVGIGETSPSARLEIRGSGATSSTTALRVENSNASASLVVLDNGNVGIGTTTPSASLHVEGNFQISTGSLYTYGQNTDIDSGSIRTVMSVSTGSYRAAFFDYVLNKSTNARAGTVFSVWNGASVEWNDVSTNDIGNTAEVNLSVGLSGANVLLYASSSTNDWSVKALARML